MCVATVSAGSFAGESLTVGRTFAGTGGCAKCLQFCPLHAVKLQNPHISQQLTLNGHTAKHVHLKVAAQQQQQECECVNIVLGNNRHNRWQLL